MEYEAAIMEVRESLPWRKTERKDGTSFETAVVRRVGQLCRTWGLSMEADCQGPLTNVRFAFIGGGGDDYAEHEFFADSMRREDGEALFALVALAFLRK